MSSTILCVDDERIVLVALREQLQRHLGDDCLVEMADDGESALEILAETIADGGTIPLVITDQIMPGIKGDELVARIHALSPETRNVMLTGQATAAAVGSALNSGGLYRFLSKPWDQDDLMMTVREALRSHARDEELAAQRVTLREVHAAAIDLTASLAASDRYARLLARVVPIVGAECAALVRCREDRWTTVAATGLATDEVSALLSPEVLDQWDEDAHGDGPVRRSAVPGAQALWGSDRCASGLSVPLRLADDTVGLLLLGSSRSNAFAGVDDDRLRAAAGLAAAALHTAELVDALEESSLRRQKVAQELVRQANTLLAGVLRGDSVAAKRLRQHISRIADLDPRERILVCGQPGSGREAVARGIHAESPRSDRPFILVSCAMLRGSLELLGSEESPGKIDLAKGGTLFLEGIEHLSVEDDAALRAALEGPRGRPLDVRVIASTALGAGNQELGSVGAWGSAARVVLPSLHDRAEDIPAMVELFLRVQASRLSRGDLSLSEASMDRLQAYAWPGNVRELINVIERVALTADGSAAEVDAALFELGRTVGSYTLIEAIGSGGMGDVWRAKHKHLARPAAVKLIQGRPGVGLQPDAIQRFRREAEATARLRSPHTVELYDFGATEESGFFYVMELLEGMDLQQLIGRHGALPAERAVFLLAQALLSLTEAHEAGMVHRDIKPANIFVCQLGANNDFVKVLDFGLVTALDSGEMELTAEGAVAGTPEFMAPENASDDELDGRSDLYSLGGVAFWLLTGQRVFDLKSPASLILAHLTRPPDRPSDRLRTPLPDGLDEWVLSMLAKSREDRPPTAREAYRRLMAIELPARWTSDRAEVWWGSRRPRRSVPPEVEEAPTRRAKPRPE